MIVTCDGQRYEVGNAASPEDHAFVRQMLAAADAGEQWRKGDLQRVANIALLARPLAVRVKELEILNSEGSLV